MREHQLETLYIGQAVLYLTVGQDSLIFLLSILHKHIQYIYIICMYVCV